MVGKDEGGAPGDYSQSFMNDSAPTGLGLGSGSQAVEGQKGQRVRV